jgi:hypothetical protein
MYLGGANADRQILGDYLGRLAGDDALENLALATTERRNLAHRLGCRRIAPAIPVARPRGIYRGQQTPVIKGRFEV